MAVLPAMGPLESAKDRLERALDRLEAAAEAALAAPRAGAQARADAAGELAALKADRDRLSTALAAVQTKYADLRTVSEAVTARLDSTIGKVRGILEG